jgi:hypothetical protein
LVKAEVLDQRGGMFQQPRQRVPGSQWGVHEMVLLISVVMWG